MSQQVFAELPSDWDETIANLITEDDEPVDSPISEREMRLLVRPLYSSWKPLTDDEPPQPRKFLAAANVGIFTSPYLPPIVPDMFLSLDVEPQQNWFEKIDRAYFVWEFDKVPDVVIEIVSNRVGGELGEKMKRYAKMGVGYYVVFDPLRELNDDVLRVYELGFGGRRYHLRKDFNLPDVGLSLTLWRGEFEGCNFEWLRWCDAKGNIIPTGQERANKEARKAKAEARKAKAEAERAERLAAKLRELGIDPTQV
jgi:Uma2 family endonuclease